MTLQVQTTVLCAWRGGDKHMFEQSSPGSIASRSTHQKSLQPRLFLAKSSAHGIGSPLVPKLRVLLSRRSSRLSGGVRCDVVRDLLVSKKLRREEIKKYFLCVIECYFFGLETLDENFGRDAALMTKHPVQHPPEFRAYPMHLPGSSFVQN